MTALECAQLKELWKDRIDDYRASGLSRHEWCAQQGVTVERLRHWSRKLQPPDAAASEATWVTVDRPRALEPAEESLMVTMGSATITVRPGFLQNLVPLVSC